MQLSLPLPGVRVCSHPRPVSHPTELYASLWKSFKSAKEMREACNFPAMKLAIRSFERKMRQLEDALRPRLERAAHSGAWDILRWLWKDCDRILQDDLFYAYPYGSIFVSLQHSLEELGRCCDL